MKKNDRFGKEWSSDSRDQQYPSDNQAAQGLGFLGADAPTTGLHDALWQANDWKDNWLYDQIKTACERYGQSLDLSVGGSRNALADAIRQALLSQNQASESRVGILEIASRDETMKGEDALRAVVPAHLRAVLDDRFSQLGSAARHNEGDFERAGAAQAVKDGLKSGAYADVIDGDYGTSYKDLPFGGIWKIVSSGALRNIFMKFYDDLAPIARSNKITDADGSLPLNRVAGVGDAADRGVFDTDDVEKIPWGYSKLTTTGALRSVYEYMKSRLNGLGSAARKNEEDFDKAGAAQAVKDNLKAGAYADVIDGDYGTSYKDLPFGGIWKTPSSGIIRNVFMKFYDDLAPVARSNKITDADGSLPVDRVAGAGEAARKGFFDTGDVSKIPYGYIDAASSGCVAIVRDYAKGLFDGLKGSLGAAAFWGVHDNNNPNDLRDGETKLVTEGTLKGLRDRLQTGYGISTFVLATRVDSSGTIKYGQTIEGRYLRTSATTYTENPTELTGTWLCLGEALDGRAGHGSRTTLWVRIS